MDYILGQVLYTGSETRVVRATHSKSGAAVVLKIPREDPPSMPVLQKLRHEYTILCALDAPGIIRPLALEPRGQSLALVLEPWGDMSLDRLLAGGPLPVETALRIAAMVARALGQVHRRGVIHRDVKPQNILIDQGRSEARLIDFGLATRREQVVEAGLAAQELAGTLAYIAPEQTGRMNRVVDTRADLYGLGATLYQMLTGALPYETTDALALIHAHIVKAPPPPHLRAPEQKIPEPVSAIVLKLMANSPEHRYQSGDGAAYDLMRAAATMVETGTVAPFSLAMRDWDDRLRPPSRLFGRERESAALQEALAKASAGEVVLSLVAGPSGVGKSALVEGLRSCVREQRGLFAPGKFDQLQQSMPYSALSQALRSVVQRKLGAAAAVLVHWKQLWQEVAGPHGQVLIDLIPELVHFLGEPKPLPEAGPMEAVARLQRLVRRFVRTLGAVSSPLVLVIDDLQWADPASLSLLQELATDPEGGHLLIVGTYRSDEVGSGHALHGLALAAREKGVAVQTLSLLPLGEHALAAMVSEILDRPVAEVTALAQLVKEKTEGSPFFVLQFLKLLHSQRLLVRVAETGQWRWQREAIERVESTDNVVALLTRRLEALSPALRKALQTAACIGSRFEPELVSPLLQQTVEELREALAEAIQEGLVLPADEGDAYLFAHDRVQQAAYEMRTPAERLATHLEIGRQLRARYKGACTDQELFATLYHRNQAAALLTEAEEKLDLAEQNLHAGRRAKARVAYAEAVEFLAVGKALLGEEGWSAHPELTFETHLVLAEVLLIMARKDEGVRHFERCFERARDPLERARVVGVWLPFFTVTGDLAQGIKRGIEALAGLGIHLPAAPEEDAALLGQLLQELEPALAGMTLQDWKALPVSSDRAHELACMVLMGLGANASTLRPYLGSFCNARIVLEALRHGLVNSVLPGGTTTALFLTHGLAQLSPARRLVEAMLALRDRFQSLRAFATCLAATCLPYWAPLSQSRAGFVRAEYLAREEGERFTQDFSGVFPFYIDVLSGAHLPSIAQGLSDPELQTVMACEARRILDRVLFALVQNPAGDEQSDAIDRELAPLAQGPWGSATTTFIAGAMASFAGLHLGASAWVARTALATEPLWPASWGLPPSILFALALCITLIDGLPTASAEQRPAWEEKLAYYAARLGLWAKSCPETFLHMHLLVEAGRARHAGEHDNAARLYEEAAEDARKNGFVQGEALGLRLAGEHRLSLGRIHLARAYLREAHDAYVRWGALGAAAQLRARHPDFFPAAASEADGRLDGHDQTRTITTTKSSERGMNDHLDVASALRAAQALSGDRALDSLIGRMLGILAENAGAERAVLTLVQGGVLHVKAQLIVTTERVESDLNEPLDGSMRVPATLVQYVARSNEPVVLGQASSDSRFEEDPYLRTHRPASVLAVPLVHQGRLSGVMYLEHPRTENAFPQARVELMLLLASQAATAVENAQLYGNLEAKVQERTTALDKALKELWSEMDLARKIQTVLLPSNPQIPGYEMAAAMHPAAQVGGDYYDVFHSGAQDWVLIGDVSGHGVPAGLCMMMIQTALRTAALTLERTQRPLTVTPRRLLALADEAVRANLQQIGDKHYITLTALCLDGGTVRYAGLHQDLLIYRAARQTVERIETRGVWLGVSEEDISELLQDDELTLEAEDVLLLYTDGYTEARVAGRLLGTAGLAQVFAELCRKRLPCAALIAGLLESLKPATVQDDVTLVALRRRGNSLEGPRADT